jgi:predicted NBD/HSP70 family sugar kinase
MPQQGRYRTGDQALVRQMNLSVIMHHLRENGSVSRAALAEMSGLNKTTVSSLVQELIDQRFIEEFGLNSAGAGRPAILLRLNPAAGSIVAAEVDVDVLSVIRTNFAAEVTWRHREAIGREMGQQAILDRLLALLSEARSSAGSADGALLGIAVGVPGLVDQETGTVHFAPNLGWVEVPLRSLLWERFGCPVYVDNESNLAALGEHYFGVAQGCENVLFLSLGVGLGGGIIHEGRLYRGVSGFSGEFGHMTVDPEGLPCNCGNHGCWETLVSTAAVFRNMRQERLRERALSDGDESPESERHRGDESPDYERDRGDESPHYEPKVELLTLPMVLAAARAGDPAAVLALREVGRHLGIGIASLVNALNPDLVVLGGRLSAAGEFLLPVATAELQRRALRWSAEATQVVLAKHGADACVMGGVATVTQAVLAEPGLATGPWAERPGSDRGRGNAPQNGRNRTERHPRESLPVISRQAVPAEAEQPLAGSSRADPRSWWE